MVTPKDSKVKGITEKKEILEAIERGLGKDNFNKELHEFIYSLYTMVNENIGIDNYSVRYFRNCNMILKNVVASEIEDVENKIEIENSSFNDLKKNHEKKMNELLKSKNELKILLKTVEDDIKKYDKNILQNENLKKATLSKILLDYKNNFLDADVLYNEIKEGFYRFRTIKEFKDYAIPYLNKYIDSTICIKSSNYLQIEQRDLDEFDDESSDYIMILAEGIVEDIEIYCYELIARGY